MKPEEPHHWATPEFAPWLAGQGACLCLPAEVLTVPIPLIDLRFINERQFVWATIQTPYGSERPCFGVVTYGAQRRELGGSTFWDSESPGARRVAAVLPHGVFGFPPYTVEKLEKKSTAHRVRNLKDLNYAVRWTQWFEKAVASFISTGHP